MTDCIFCKIVDGEIPAKIVRRTDELVAFRDVDPKAPTHILLVPVEHRAAVRDFTGPEGRAVLGRLLQAAAEIAAEEGLDAQGYRLVTNTGGAAGQSVDHLHLHLLGGRALGWPPG